MTGKGRVRTAIGLVLAGALMLFGEAAAQDRPHWCGVVHPSSEPGPEAVSQAVFEDEVDTSGALAVIDILFVYSRRSGERWGSAGLRKQLEKMVDRASAYLLNSGANARLRLVGVTRGPELFDEFEDEYRNPPHYRALLRALHWARTSEEAAELRDGYGADLVYVLVEEEREPKDWTISCARATLSGSVAGISNTFAGAIDTTDYNCMNGRVLVHEVGHNLTLVHDDSDPSFYPPAIPGGRGFIGYDSLRQREYGTIMSVKVMQSETARFSSSTLTHNGRILGLPGQHEASDALRFAAPYGAALKRSKHRDDNGYGCVDGSGGDCLHRGRFRVSATYRTSTGEVKGASTREAYLGDSTSLFYFLSEDNPELLLKVMDGCASNGRYWVFGSAASDLEYEVEVADNRDGVVMTYARDRSNPLIADRSSFSCERPSSAAVPGVAGSERDAGNPQVPAVRPGWRGRELTLGPGESASRPAGPAVEVRLGQAPAPPSPEQSSLRSLVAEEPNAAKRVTSPLGLRRSCYDTVHTDCMVNGRFRASIHPESTPTECLDCFVPGLARVRDAVLGDNAAAFYFDTWDNPDVLVKVVDNCAVNGHYQVFASAATLVKYWLLIVDFQEGGGEVEYERSKDDPVVSDVRAFPCSPLDLPPPDEDPEVEVSFGSLSYEVPEGGTVEITVVLSGDPERDVSIPLVRTHGGGASEADYSGVPASITFSSSVTARTFELAATDDSEEDFGESVVLGFGVLPAGVSRGGSATVSIQDDDTPPMAVISVSGVECDRELCRALTGERVEFTDASTGPTGSRRWEFGEGTESDLRRPSHTWSEPGFYEVTLWVSDGARESTSSRVFLVESSSPAGTCESSAETRCLQDSRYAVAVEWRKPDGESGAGKVVHAGTNDSGLFTFFNRDNWEILIKVLDGCALNGHVWVYGASTTDLGYTIRVTDTATDAVKEYRNEPGMPAPAITDGTAFPLGCTPAAR